MEEQSSAGGEVTVDPLLLPDIKDMLKKKEIQRELEQLEEELRVDVKKIKRSDKVAFNKVCHIVVELDILLCECQTILCSFRATVTGAGSVCRHGRFVF
jgi:hypothetical protein